MKQKLNARPRLAEKPPAPAPDRPVTWSVQPTNVDTVMVAGKVMKRGGAFSGGNSEGRMDLAKLKELPAQMRELVLGGLADAISHVFLWAVFFTIAVPVLAWFIREVPLRSSQELSRSAEQTPEEDAEAALARSAVR